MSPAAAPVVTLYSRPGCHLCAVARIQLDTERSRHPVFGELSLDEWDSLHLRHAELHMSFLVPRLPELAAAAAPRSG